MLANFLSKTRPINYVLVLTLLLLSFSFHTFSVYFTEFNFLTTVIFLANLIALFFMVLLINFVIRKNMLTKDNSNALFFVVLFFMMFPMAMKWSVIFISNLFVLIALRRIYSLRNNTRITVKLYNAGFWLGIAILFYNTTAFFGAILILGMMAYGKLNLKNIMATILGLLTPVFLFYVYCLVTDDLTWFKQWTDFTYSLDFRAYGNLSLILTLTLLLSSIIWSAISVTAGLKRVNQKHKATWYLMLFNLIVAFLVILITTEKTSGELIFIFFPASVIIGNYIQKEKDNWFKNLVIYMLFFTAVSVFFL